MNIGSTEFLRILGEKPGRYLLLERAAPRGRLKENIVTLKEPDGRDIQLMHPSGYRSSPLVLPTVILDDFLRASFVEMDTDNGAEATFRLTPDGLARSHSAAA